MSGKVQQRTLDHCGELSMLSPAAMPSI